MPVIYQKYIDRQDLRANPGVLYLFGDNLLRRGKGGQAGAMRGEPNAVGVATKLSPTHGSNAYMADTDLEANIEVFADDLSPAIAKLEQGGIVVIPLDGLGTGLSEMPAKCPLSLVALNQMLNTLHTIEPVEYED